MSRKKHTITSLSSFVVNINALADKIGGKHDLANAIGVSYSAILQWCNGENLPDGKRLLAISEKFGVSLDWLLAGKDPGADFMSTWTEDVVRACHSLKEILEARDPIIAPALQANLAAFREAVKRKVDNDALKKRLDTVEKKLKYMEKVKDGSLGKGSGTD
jgi:transcriptional regulator with XRE-family HTH domain